MNAALIFTHDKYNILTDIHTYFEVNLGIITEIYDYAKVCPNANLHNSLKIGQIKMI